MPPLSKKTAKGKADGKKSRKLYLLLILLLSGFIYYKHFGIPKFLLDKLPEKVTVFLGLTEPEPEVVMQAPRRIPVPKLIARGFSVEEPVVPVNASIEDMVITLRPDVYFRDKNKLILRAEPHPWPKELKLALEKRIFLKDAFYIMLNTFHEAMPDGMGYLDLVYQAPNYYFARVITIDAKTRNTFINNLKSKGADLKVIDSVAYKNGNIEFSLQGSIRLHSQQQLSVVPHSKMNSEILALHHLAVVNNIRLEGLENPIEEDFGLYRTVILKTITEADYPSLLDFADALQKSNITLGIQKFVSSPLNSDRMQTAIEFVMYVK